MPKVSVVIATYNRGHFICGAIESAFAQTFKDFEVIVVDDGSSDNTKEELEKYASRIHYIFQENKGRAEARNTAIMAAKGEYVAFLDDDDIWLPHKLGRQVAFLDSNPDIGLVHAFVEMIDEGGCLLQKETNKWRKLYMKAMKIGYTYEGMSRFCVMFLSTVMVRRNCIGQVGLFDSGIRAFEDWDVYLRIALKYRIGTIRQPLVRHRLHRTHTTMPEFIQGQIKVSMKHLAIADSSCGLALRNRIRHNFYIRLGNAYYTDTQLAMFRYYVLKALKLNPLILFFPRLILHFFLSLMPVRMVQVARVLKRLQSYNANIYPERIILEEETFSGPLAAHLKRYDFAKHFCANKVVLDAACGTGYGSHYLAEFAKEVIGIDISKEAITYAKEHYQRENIQFKAMDVHNLEFPDKYFDAVCSFETLEHLEEPVKFVSEVKRVLKDDGIFIISTPYTKRTTYNPKNPYHKVEFSRKEFEGFLKKYFMNVEIFGQRRLQSIFHYYLQKIDIFHLRAMLSPFVRRKICHAVATQSWDEADLRDFTISKERLKRTTELIGVCKDF
jgi:glycosyltransferase involved in cell wall biosynthesis/ubiquinone/menaquinone biosynthesis C-methylase UbiE